ncbi:putative shikimate kinase [Lyophyllum shimeji]|uniref:Gluconokinase n=1 Tax=Lyophyllum shimeji TaxID=47721 RepID=A0A9P3PKF5_LYOSH|nr:putative shikimate kinase [Lyophyllum shimeji]
MSLAAHEVTREQPDRPHPQQPRPVFIVVMGVSGTGKSTLGRALAARLNVPYIEGDDLHPATNVAKMSAGIPLTDADREPWLALIRATAERITLSQERHREGEQGRPPGVVISSSALKRYYRDILRGKRVVGGKAEEERDGEEEKLRTYFVFIEGPREVLLDRMEKRPGHFMKATMLDSQLNTLESPAGEEGVVVVSVEESTEEQVRKAIEGLKRLGAGDVLEGVGD